MEKMIHLTDAEYQELLNGNKKDQIKEYFNELGYIYTKCTAGYYAPFSSGFYLNPTEVGVINRALKAGYSIYIGPHMGRKLILKITKETL